MNKKLVAAIAAGTLSLVGTSVLAYAQEVDPWEAAANEYHAKVAKEKEAQAEAEKYVKENIDTPTGAESKAKEDDYLDKAEAQYKKELAKQDADKKDNGKKDNGKKEADKKEADKKDNAKKPAAPTKQVKKLPKTSAVK